VYLFYYPIQIGIPVKTSTKLQLGEKYDASTYYSRLQPALLFPKYPFHLFKAG
jgi:hypothetical protein